MTRINQHFPSAKSSLNAWYSKAEGNWLGNAGKRLPNSSFFGQDLSDRDRYKSAREAAAQRIGQFHRQRATLDADISRRRKNIEDIKGDRQVMLDLKTEGFEKHFLLGVIDRALTQQAELSTDIATAELNHVAFVAQERIRRGIPALDQRIEAINLKKIEYLASFDTPESRATRKAVHRRAWMQQHYP